MKYLFAKVQLHEYDSYLCHKTFLWKGFMGVSTFCNTHGTFSKIMQKVLFNALFLSTAIETHYPLL